MLFALYVCFDICSEVKVTEWPPVGTKAAHSASDMFSWYKYLIVNLVFPHLGFWSGYLFLIDPFPDHCLFVPFHPMHLSLKLYFRFIEFAVSVLKHTLWKTIYSKHCSAILLRFGTISILILKWI